MKLKMATSYDQADVCQFTLDVVINGGEYLMCISNYCLQLKMSMAQNLKDTNDTAKLNLNSAGLKNQRGITLLAIMTQKITTSFLTIWIFIPSF